MNEEQHLGSVASGLVMLAAIATTFTTYTYYKDDVVATQYEDAQASLEQTASALMSLRLQEEAMAAVDEVTSTTTEVVESI